MNIAQIEQNVGDLLKSHDAGDFSNSEFIYEFLLAYGHLKQSVSRLRSGERNMASKSNDPKHDEVVWKRHLHFKVVPSDRLHSEIDAIRKDKATQSYRIRFIIVTDFNELLAVDTKTTDTLDIPFVDLSKQFDFFLPWAGMEKAVYQGENPADVKAAEKMAKLFDYIKEDNFDDSNKDDPEALHNLNVFLTRLLFCFFAEDTEIFGDNQFSQAIKSHTKEDGSDLADYLDRLFIVLNTAKSDRGDIPDYLNDFEYVNGGLFGETIPAPSFSRKSRRMLVECGNELDWSDINPDIFGSMIQAVVHPDQRSGMGMHYTSVTNIMKVIEPLFLNDFYEELEKVENNPRKLQQLQQRLGQLKIFDPACGSGNFLIIAYKELRLLENEILKRLQELEFENTGQVCQAFSVMQLSQFYGIELDDFAHEVAILSLWLSEHQMNIEFKTEFGEATPALPLRKGGNIICGNAAQLEWDHCCDNSESETYVVGNPPFLGARNQDREQKSDVRSVFANARGCSSLDYICCWFVKAARYMSALNTKSAFVSTNSICQGEQVSSLWPHIFKNDVEIFFSHLSFPWTNNAKNKAVVTCIIVGLRPVSKGKKTIFFNNYSQEVSNISPYLTENHNVIVHKRSRPLFDVPKLVYGNQAIEGGHLILSESEVSEITKCDSRLTQLIRPLTGAEDYIKGKRRWCLWINEDQLDNAMSQPLIKSRIEKVRQFREEGGEVARSLAHIPYRFRYVHEAEKVVLILPRTTSERRDYLPMGLLDSKYIVTDAAQVIYDPKMYIMGILMSSIHMCWVKAVAGRLKTDIRYSNALCYNSFPFPDLTPSIIDEIEGCLFEVLSARELYPNMTIADLYDPNTMPKELLEAHKKLDQVVENAYREKPFSDNQDRLKHLFNCYEQMTETNNA